MSVNISRVRGSSAHLYAAGGLGSFAGGLGSPAKGLGFLTGELGFPAGCLGSSARGPLPGGRGRGRGYGRGVGVCMYIIYVCYTRIVYFPFEACTLYCTSVQYACTYAITLFNT